MRTLKLTHEEILMIVNSLELMYGTKLNVVKENRYLLKEEHSKGIISDANTFDDLRSKIDNGDADV